MAEKLAAAHGGGVGPGPWCSGSGDAADGAWGALPKASGGNGLWEGSVAEQPPRLSLPLALKALLAAGEAPRQSVSPGIWPVLVGAGEMN